MLYSVTEHVLLDETILVGMEPADLVEFVGEYGDYMTESSAAAFISHVKADQEEAAARKAAEENKPHKHRK